MSLYLDHNATSPLDPRVLEAMTPWLLGAHGNPASVHKPGRAAHVALEQAREQVAALVAAKPAEVTFTGGGTENLAGIVGFGKAAELAAHELEQRASHSRALRDALETEVRKLPGVRVFSGKAERLPNTLQFGIEGLDGEWLVMELDKRGIAVSSGSACHSGKGEPSHVLLAMGLDPALAKGALRVSFGPGNTREDVQSVAKALQEITASRGQKVAAVGW